MKESEIVKLGSRFILAPGLSLFTAYNGSPVIIETIERVQQGEYDRALGIGLLSLMTTAYSGITASYALRGDTFIRENVAIGFRVVQGVRRVNYLLSNISERIISSRTW